MPVKPEEVGLSSQQLENIEKHLKARYIDSKKISGCLTLVARKGQIAYLEPLGLMDRERNKPMQEDTIVRIYSMTKPITSVALMMLYEKGIFQLDDQWVRMSATSGNLCSAAPLAAVDNCHRRSKLREAPSNLAISRFGGHL